MLIALSVISVLVGGSGGGAVAGPRVSQPAVVVVASPPNDRSNSHYVSNRAPLALSPLVKLPVGAIKPGGWLRGQLELMRHGMTGNLERISPWCKFEKSAWASPTGEGEFGWEELPYWLKGYGDLGYVLGDEKIKANAKRWIDAILAGQDKDCAAWIRANRDPTAASTERDSRRRRSRV